MADKTKNVLRSGWLPPVYDVNQDVHVMSHSHTTKFGPNQTESICRGQIKCNKNDSAFDRVENIVGKGEIACTSNFPLFLQ